MPRCAATEDFFRLRLDQMIDLRHPLAVLASHMPWQQIEPKNRSYPGTESVGGGVGRPIWPTMRWQM